MATKWLSRGRTLGVAWAALALLAVAATAWAYGGMERYEPDGRDWLGGGAPFAEGWTVEGPASAVRVGPDGTLRLANADLKGGVGLRRSLARRPGDAAVFDVTVTAWTEDVEGGRRGWRGGRVTLAEPEPGVPYVRGRDREVANMQGPRAPATYAKRFVFGSDTPAVELAARLRFATGTLALCDLEVRGLVERAAFTRAADALRLAWGALALGGLALLLRRVEGRGPRAALAAVAVAGAVIIMMPHSYREEVALALTRDLFRGKVLPEDAARIGHFCLFAAVGLVTRLARPRDNALLQLAALVLLGGASELAQLMADARAPSLLDWGTDAAGAALGLCAALILARRRVRDAVEGPTG